MVIEAKLSNGRAIKYLSENEVKENLSARGFSNDKSLIELERSDITKHVYEGGFKVWECSIDLSNLIESCGDLFKEKKVIELGCGAGLPGILALLHGSKQVIFQDFNECVVQCFTKDNVFANSLPIDGCSFVGSSWENLETVEKNSCDVVLTSETIYNEEDYKVLHDALSHCLSNDGFCWLAAKFFYFGLSGNVPSFMNFVEKQGIFNVTEKVSIDSSVPRRILEIRRKS